MPALVSSAQGSSAALEDEQEGPDEPITAEALHQASDATIDYAGERWFNDTEVGEDEGYCEVEKALDNGWEVDVHLEQTFNVLGVEAD